jgi:hypothetical protein
MSLPTIPSMTWHPYQQRSDMVPVLLSGQEVTYGTLPEILVVSAVSRPLRIQELIAWNGDNLKELVPEPHPMILIHQVTVNSSVRSVTARIT